MNFIPDPSAVFLGLIILFSNKPRKPLWNSWIYTLHTAPTPSPPPRYAFHICSPCRVCVYSFCSNSFPFLPLSSLHFHSFQATGWGL
ncbi:hypothetical protein ATANTOWER_012900 [Ataeniobius toweri]|uniref:Uncharacterized protein n=1 Tax=Ataeniobius toweri TaxID=208326 RepID=A0ABU7C248_9TELE|nr:hypothetical protein [Ataeniobius toweri]